jgi:hypothetical protein
MLPIVILGTCQSKVFRYDRHCKKNCFNWEVCRIYAPSPRDCFSDNQWFCKEALWLHMVQSPYSFQEFNLCLGWGGLSFWLCQRSLPSNMTKKSWESGSPDGCHDEYPMSTIQARCNRCFCVGPLLDCLHPQTHEHLSLRAIILTSHHSHTHHFTWACSLILHHPATCSPTLSNVFSCYPLQSPIWKDHLGFQCQW